MVVGDWLPKQPELIHMETNDKHPRNDNSEQAPSRREFLIKSGITLGSLALPSAVAAALTAPHAKHALMIAEDANAQPFKFGSEPKRQRKSFFDLTDDEVKNLCRAVGYMRNGSKAKPLNVDDPLQWDRYVASHARHCTEAGFDQVHWSWFFLPWHRAYLFFLERILADILTKVFSLDGSKFALPYWDWISHKEIPNTSERTQKGLASPLFGYDLTQEDMVSADNLGFDNLALSDGYRGPTILKPQMDPANEVSPESKEHIEETISFMQPEYVANMLKLSFEDFAGKPTTSQADGMGVLEHNPHNNGHDWVGSRFGSNRDMGTLRYAALDPVFSMHHANIDRIWSLYRKPQPDPKTSPWGKQKYTFLDLTGQPVSVTVRDVIESMSTVQYLPPASTLPQTKIFLAAVPAISSNAAQEEKEIIVQKAQTLTAKPLTIQAESKPTLKQMLDKSDAPGESSVSILEITTGPIPVTEKFTIRVFVNKADADAHTSIKDPAYVGRIRALASEARGSESGALSHSFLIILGGRDSRFYQLVRPGAPFAITLVPVGSEQTLKGFSVPIKEIKLKIVK
jgi:polyphenol oxidase